MVWYPSKPANVLSSDLNTSKSTFRLQKYEAFEFLLNFCQITAYGLSEWNYICPKVPGCLSCGVETYKLKKAGYTIDSTSLVPPDSRSFNFYIESGIAALTSVNFLVGG